MISSNPEATVLLKHNGAVANVTLNRPKALNALEPSMVNIMNDMLHSWNNDDKDSNNNPSVMLMKGNGGKAFCAGGDVKAVWKDCMDISDTLGTGEPGRFTADFFYEEYIMNYNLGISKVPQISLWDGVVMGGGVGISIFGEYRIATEKTLFAMPETAIGLFPDVGSSAWLPHIGDGMGEYLALTGARLKARDLIALGIATHYLDSERASMLEDELVKGLDKSKDNNDNINVKGMIDLILMELQEESNVMDLTTTIFTEDQERGRARIAACFENKNTIEEIMTSLQGLATAGTPDDVTWANNTLKAMNHCSPTSLKVTLAQIQRGRSLNLKECLEMEYRVAQACMRNNDFKEGVRALLVDKDKNPKWSPSSLADVNESIVDDHFSPLKRELVLNDSDNGLMGGARRIIM